MTNKDNVKSDTIRLASRCITNNKQQKRDDKMIKVNVAKIINDTMTRKKKKVINKTHASICQRSKATLVIMGLFSAWLYCLIV